MLSKVLRSRVAVLATTVAGTALIRLGLGLSRRSETP